MRDIINIEIQRSSYDKINQIKKWFNIKFRSNSNKKIVIEYIVNDFIKTNNIDYIDNGYVSPSRVEGFDIMLKDYRSDIHLDSSLKEDIKCIQEYLKNKGEDKTSINDVIRKTVLKYIELNPEMQQIKLKNKYIKQKILMEEQYLEKNNKND